MRYAAPSILEAVMASITIRDLDEPVEASLLAQAALHGHSPEEEARDILRWGLLDQPAQEGHLAAAINGLFKPLGGLDLPELPREAMRADRSGLT
jgi:plasmid stability protein